MVGYFSTGDDLFLNFDFKSIYLFSYDVVLRVKLAFINKHTMFLQKGINLEVSVS